MNIIINCRQMDLTNNLREYAEDKISRFSKYLNNITEATVTLSVEKYRHKAEVHLKVNGSIIQAESITGEMYSSIDDVVEKLARQVRKHKGKTVTQRKGKGKTGPAHVSGETFPSIIKNKSYDIKPMSVEEAGMQMDLSDRSFFVFTNASSGDINVLYKRSDGNFGLIEPLK
jgi:putative sigma-54 modulation protein